MSISRSKIFGQILYYIFIHFEDLWLAKNFFMGYQIQYKVQYLTMQGSPLCNSSHRALNVGTIHPVIMTLCYHTWQGQLRTLLYAISSCDVLLDCQQHGQPIRVNQLIIISTPLQIICHSIYDNFKTIIDVSYHTYNHTLQKL